MRRKVEDFNDRLPYWEVEYQLCSEVYKNSLIADCNAVYRKVDKAKHGVNFFGSVMDMGLPANEIRPLMLAVKSLMQKTHPDKASGYEDQFQQMKKCSDWIKSGIPLPTPTYSIEPHQSKTSRLKND